MASCNDYGRSRATLVLEASSGALLYSDKALDITDDDRSRSHNADAATSGARRPAKSRRASARQMSSRSELVRPAAAADGRPALPASRSIDRRRSRSRPGVRGRRGSSSARTSRTSPGTSGRAGDSRACSCARRSRSSARRGRRRATTLALRRRRSGRASGARCCRATLRLEVDRSQVAAGAGRGDVRGRRHASATAPSPRSTSLWPPRRARASTRAPSSRARAVPRPTACRIGPYAVVGPDVRDRRRHVDRRARGRRQGARPSARANRIFPFASGRRMPPGPQVSGARRARSRGGDNIGASTSRSTPVHPADGGGMATRIGSGCLLHGIGARRPRLAARRPRRSSPTALRSADTSRSSDFGHHRRLAGVHQFVRIGESALCAAGAMVSTDVPPFCIVAGDRARLHGLNIDRARGAAASRRRRSGAASAPTGCSSSATAGAARAHGARARAALGSVA